MIGLWKTKRRFTRPQKFYFCLCISDILVGIFNVPLQITLLIHPLCEIMAVQQFLGFFPVNFSMLIMLSIIIDRYLLVTKTIFYNKHILNQRIVIIIAANTVIPFMLGVPHVIISLSNNKQVGTLVIVQSIWILFIMVVMATLNYLLIIHVKRISTITRRDTGRQGQYSNKVTNLVIMLSIIMIICYLPSQLGYLILGIYIYSGKSNAVLQYYSTWVTPLILLNTTINSVIYVKRSTSIKDYYRTSFRQTKRATTGTLKTTSFSITNNTGTV